ncbi:hypothetical protein [Desulfocicer niacini]
MKIQIEFITILAVFSVVILTAPIAHADTVKRYTIPSGVIEYRMSGGGNMMGTVTKTEGKKTLYFKDHGSISLETEDTATTISGIVNKQTSTHTMKKVDNVTVYTVDFERKKIIKGKDPVGSQYLASGKNMAEDSGRILTQMGGQKTGTDTVLGYPCEVWSIMGGKQWLYKGQVPLRLEMDVMGMKTSFIAEKATFNTSIPDSRFELPAYEIENAPDYLSHSQGGGQGESPDEFQTMMGAMQSELESDPDMSNEQQIAMMMQAMGQSEQGSGPLQQQKEQMPKMLKVMKSMRQCLNDASTQAEADSCMEKSIKLSNQLGLPDNFTEEEDPLAWNKETKAQVLFDLDEGIEEMEQMLPCIENAQNLMDFMKCTQGE